MRQAMGALVALLLGIDSQGRVSEKLTSAGFFPVPVISAMLGGRTFALLHICGSRRRIDKFDVHPLQHPASIDHGLLTLSSRMAISKPSDA
ncbi:hypothetical protein JAAARDRAFT_62329 [Jaapia argillacea MUCL 33604]|uniref:Uncharacterized protein n=1 Tax=Jaapia argillacea MUCL 33604 TaxID=933084 RepID=A0A067PD87_9AGAM|nr:hypothetical protein JAAARDRAFT_62329 [Jaapia argillacea MUCL 33604]